jgi:hypothetical protein
VLIEVTYNNFFNVHRSTKTALGYGTTPGKSKSFIACGS